MPRSIGQIEIEPFKLVRSDLVSSGNSFWFSAEYYWIKVTGPIQTKSERSDTGQCTPLAKAKRFFRVGRY